MRLTKGITGLDSVNLIAQELQTFQSMVYHLVTSLPDATVVHFVDDPSKSYLSAIIRIEKEPLIILHHGFMPYVAFAGNEEEKTLQFLSKPALHKFFPMRKCLEAEVLATSIMENHRLHSLSPVEWQFIETYNATTIGEVLFNKWNNKENQEHLNEIYN